MEKKRDAGPYWRLAAALGASSGVMFVSMFSRVDAWGNVYAGVNQVYMTGLMVAPMLVVMVLAMWPMYGRKRLNAGLIAVGLVMTGACWWAVRSQAWVGDDQFLRSMIPHHAAAILVCEEAAIEDERIRRLCEEIVAAQRREIEEMKAIMRDRAGG